ncbi:hypothetical protein H0H92_013391 [Tricholoma furcatifolium]|nr:hypothetical protein H0H92_013391 [Tricholoma furcatifolium]
MTTSSNNSPALFISPQGAPTIAAASQTTTHESLALRDVYNELVPRIKDENGNKIPTNGDVKPAMRKSGVKLKTDKHVSFDKPSQSLVHKPAYGDLRGAASDQATDGASVRQRRRD